MESKQSGSEFEVDFNNIVDGDPMNDSEEIIFVGAVTDREWELYTARKLFEQKLELASRDRLSLYESSNQPPCTGISDIAETANIIVDEMRDNDDAAGGTLAPPSTPETVVESHPRWSMEPRVRRLAGRTLLETFQEGSETERDEIQSCQSLSDVDATVRRENDGRVFSESSPEEKLPRFPDLLKKFESYVSTPKSEASDVVIMENVSTPKKADSRASVYAAALGSPYLTRSAVRASKLFSLAKEPVGTPKLAEVEYTTNKEADFIVVTPERTQISCSFPETNEQGREDLDFIDETPVKDNRSTIPIMPGSASIESVSELFVPSQEEVESPVSACEESVAELFVTRQEQVVTPVSASEESVSELFVPGQEQVESPVRASEDSVSELFVPGREEVESPASTIEESVLELFVTSQEQVESPVSTIEESVLELFVTSQEQVVTPVSAIEESVLELFVTSQEQVVTPVSASEESVSELHISNHRYVKTGSNSVAQSPIFDESPLPLASVSYVNVRSRMSKYSQVIGHKTVANRLEIESPSDINTGCRKDVLTASCVASPASDNEHTSILTFLNDYLQGSGKKVVTKDTILETGGSFHNDSITTVPLSKDVTITVKDNRTEKSIKQISIPKTPDSTSSEENMLELCVSVEDQRDLETADCNAKSNGSPAFDNKHTSILTVMDDYLHGGTKEVVTKDTVREVDESLGNDSSFKDDNDDSNKENIAVEDRIEHQGKDMLLMTLQRRFDKHRVSTMSDLSLNDTYTLKDATDASEGNDISLMSDMSSFLADEAACRSLFVKDTSVASARDTSPATERASSSRIDEEDINVSNDDPISINISGITKFQQTVSAGNVSSVSADEDGGFLNTLTDLALLHSTMHKNIETEPAESQYFCEEENDASSSSIQFNDTLEEMENLEIFGMEYVKSGKDVDFTQRKKDMSMRNESAFSVDLSFSANKTYNKRAENVSSISSETEVKRNIFGAEHSAADSQVKQRFFGNTSRLESSATTTQPPRPDVAPVDACLKINALQSSTSGTSLPQSSFNRPLPDTKDESGSICPQRFFSNNSLNEPAVSLCSTTKASKEFYFPKPMSTVKTAKPKYVHEVTPLKVPENALKCKSANGRFFTHVSKTPEQPKIVARSPASRSPSVKTASNFNIQSPIGAYINHTPSPSLVANVKPPQVGVYLAKFGKNKKLFPEVIRGKDAASHRGLENVAPNKLCSPLPQVVYKSTSSLKLDEPSASNLPQLDEKMKRLVGSPRLIVNKHTGRVKASQLPSGSPINHGAQLPAVAVDDSCFVGDVDGTQEAEVSVVVCKDAYRTNTLSY